ncbi:MAG: hypothetical protein LBH69_01530, partial [Methanomassiliicoccaceae archaeon]|nr:hypothetical protein [Methanomassiliicoccaceae archaeon]
MFGGDNVADQTLGSGTVGDREYIPALDIFVIAIDEVDISGGEFTLDEGYLYKIELRGGAGENGDSSHNEAGGAGGEGAVMVIWMDCTGNVASVTYTYEIIAGGAGGQKATAGAGENGGAGGAAVIVWDDNGDIVAVAAGGGGGGGAAYYNKGVKGSSAENNSAGAGPEGEGYDGLMGLDMNAGGGGGGG